MFARLLTALCATLLISGVAPAQEAWEYGRVSGGAVELLTKQSSSSLSGSLGITMSRGKGYEATLGGTILQDRLWFFGTAYQQDVRFAPQQVTMRGIDTKVTGQLGDAQTLTALFAANQQPSMMNTTLPSSFLSLRYTGIVSSNMFFNMSVTQSSTRQSHGIGFLER